MVNPRRRYQQGRMAQVVALTVAAAVSLPVLMQGSTPVSPLARAVDSSAQTTTRVGQERARQGAASRSAMRVPLSFRVEDARVAEAAKAQAIREAQAAYVERRVRAANAVIAKQVAYVERRVRAANIVMARQAPRVSRARAAEGARALAVYKAEVRLQRARAARLLRLRQAQALNAQRAARARNLAEAAERAAAAERTAAANRTAAADRIAAANRTAAAANRKTNLVSPLLNAGSPKAYARSLVDGSQFGCLELLWTRESGWNYRASNPSSGAYGIPQSLPGSKMASAGADWQTNPYTQIKWGLGYIQDRYGSPCAAWGHSEAVGWY